MAPITQDVTPTASAFCPKVTQGTNQVMIPGGMGVKKFVAVVRKVSLASYTIKTFFGFSLNLYNVRRRIVTAHAGRVPGPLNRQISTSWSSSPPLGHLGGISQFNSCLIYCARTALQV